MSKSVASAEKNRRFQVGGMVAVAFVVGGLAHQANAAAVIVNPSFNVTDSGGFPATLFAGDYTSGMGSTFLNPYRNNTPVNVAGWTSTTQNFLAGVENSARSLTPMTERRRIWQARACSVRFLAAPRIRDFIF